LINARRILDWNSFVCSRVVAKTNHNSCHAQSLVLS
jgi:hypothetical protein